MILRVYHIEEQSPDQQNIVLKIPTVMKTAGGHMGLAQALPAEFPSHFHFQNFFTLSFQKGGLFSVIILLVVALGLLFCNC